MNKAHKQHSGGPAKDDLLTVSQAAEILCVFPATVQRWLREGELVGTKLKGRWVIRAQDLSDSDDPMERISAEIDPEDLEMPPLSTEDDYATDPKRLLKIPGQGRQS